MIKISIGKNNYYIKEDGPYSLINRDHGVASFFISKLENLDQKDIPNLNYTTKTLRELSKYFNDYKLAIKKYRCYKVFQ